MTCIVGIEHEGAVYIGGDTAGVDDSFNIQSRRDEKVFINGDLIMGFTSSFRMGQLLRYALDPPEHSQKKDDMEYLVTDLIDAIRDVYKERGYMGEADDKSETGGTFLLGYRGSLYYVEDNFQVGRMYDQYMAVGCGKDFALGVLHATSNLQLDPTVRINMALDAACHHSAGVRAPYTILSSG